MCRAPSLNEVVSRVRNLFALRGGGAPQHGKKSRGGTAFDPVHNFADRKCNGDGEHNNAESPRMG